MTDFRVVPSETGLQYFRDQDEITEAEWFAAWSKGNMRMALDLIEHFIDDDTECSLDHHGYCQHHAGGFMDGGCWQPKARAFLIANGREP
jgi:hypothetical protein